MASSIYKAFNVYVNQSYSSRTDAIFFSKTRLVGSFDIKTHFVDSFNKIVKDPEGTLSDSKKQLII